jgi:hypothetical protein
MQEMDVKINLAPSSNSIDTYISVMWNSKFEPIVTAIVY